MSSEVSPSPARPEPRENDDVTRGWHLWRSDAGSGAYYATRSGTRLTDQEIQAGCVMTAAADTEEALLHLLRQQAALQGA